MRLRVWRIVKKKYIADAFSGEGARRYGGRWNSPGTRIIYTSGTASLAVLEIMVNLDTSMPLPAYALIHADFADEPVEKLDRRTLPRDWRANLPIPQTQELGDQWAHAGRSIALEVPSVILPTENNYLLNPEHTDFNKIKIGDPQPFSLDPRLL